MNMVEKAFGAGVSDVAMRILTDYDFTDYEWVCSTDTLTGEVSVVGKSLVATPTTRVYRVVYFSNEVSSIPWRVNITIEAEVTNKPAPTGPVIRSNDRYAVMGSTGSQVELSITVDNKDLAVALEVARNTLRKIDL